MQLRCADPSINNGVYSNPTLFISMSVISEVITGTVAFILVIGIIVVNTGQEPFFVKYVYLANGKILSVKSPVLLHDQWWFHKFDARPVSVEVCYANEPNICTKADVSGYMLYSLIQSNNTATNSTAVANATIVDLPPAIYIFVNDPYSVKYWLVKWQDTPASASIITGQQCLYGSSTWCSNQGSGNANWTIPLGTAQIYSYLTGNEPVIGSTQTQYPQGRIGYSLGLTSAPWSMNFFTISPIGWAFNYPGSSSVAYIAQFYIQGTTNPSISISTQAPIYLMGPLGYAYLTGSATQLFIDGTPWYINLNSNYVQYLSPGTAETESIQGLYSTVTTARSGYSSATVGIVAQYSSQIWYCSSCSSWQFSGGATVDPTKPFDLWIYSPYLLTIQTLNAQGVDLSLVGESAIHNPVIGFLYHLQIQYTDPTAFWFGNQTPTLIVTPNYTSGLIVLYNYNNSVYLNSPGNNIPYVGTFSGWYVFYTSSISYSQQNQVGINTPILPIRMQLRNMPAILPSLSILVRIVQRRPAGNIRQR
jgi:hypothetical protein